MCCRSVGGCNEPYVLVQNIACRPAVTSWAGVCRVEASPWVASSDEAWWRLEQTEQRPLRSWKKGALGEEALGARLNELASERLVVLHDRRIPGSRVNIDHIVVAPGGVFVIDAKHYGGQVEKRNLGNIFRKDVRVYVGRRDCTKLVLGSEDQAEVVRDVLSPLGFGDVPVRPVLCFIGAEWGLFASPFKLGHVLVTWPKFLYELLTKNDEVETAAIQDVAHALAAALPVA